MLLLEVANDVYRSQDEGGVVQSVCQSPIYGALAFDPLYTDLIIITKSCNDTTSESQFVL